MRNLRGGCALKFGGLRSSVSLDLVVVLLNSFHSRDLCTLQRCQAIRLVLSSGIVPLHHCNACRSSSGAVTERLEVSAVDGGALALTATQEQLICSLKEMQTAALGIVTQVQQAAQNSFHFWDVCYESIRLLPLAHLQFAN